MNLSVASLQRVPQALVAELYWALLRNVIELAEDQ